MALSQPAPQRQIPPHKWAWYISAALEAGMPEEQTKRFMTSGYIANPWMLAFHAAAREADLPGGPTMIGVGGARGPGKSHGVMAQVGLDDCQRAPGLKCLFLRKVQKSAAESFDDLTRKVFAAVAKEVTAGRVEFDNGSRILIGGYNNARDIDKYLGIEYDVIVLEEGTQITGEKRDMIRGSLRTSRDDWRARWYESSNPGGIGHNDFKNLYVMPYRQQQQLDTRFFPGTWKDNPHLKPEYIAYLMSLRGALGKAWREGDWDIFEGQAFPSFRFDRHVCQPFDLPTSWTRYRGVDWGYRKPFACVWLSKNPDTGRIYIYRVIKQAGLTDRQQARAILDNTLPEEKVSATFADPSMWTKKSEEARVFSTADEYAAEKLYLTKADNNRMLGKRKMDTLLADLPDGRPGLMIFDTCTEWIEDVPALPYSSTGNPEDVDSEADDHCLIAGTLITTKRGKVPIEQIVAGDEALTRRGYRRVLWSEMTVPSAVVYRVDFSNGSSIIGTGSHPVLVNGAFARIDALKYGDIIEAEVSPCRENQPVQQTPSSSTGSSSIVTPTQRTYQTENTTDQTPATSKKELAIYTKRFGSLSMGLFQKATTFTTSIITRSITTSRIWRALKGQNIYQTTTSKELIGYYLTGAQSDNLTLIQSGIYQWPGTSRQPAENGIDNMLQRHSQNRLDPFRIEPASTAEHSTSPSLWRQRAIRFVRTSVGRRIGARVGLMMSSASAQGAVKLSRQTSTATSLTARASAAHVIAVTKCADRMAVYNFEVEEAHEYFANGILVHNCYDSTRYALTKINPKPQLLLPGEMAVNDPLLKHLRTGVSVLGGKDF